MVKFEDFGWALKHALAVALSQPGGSALVKAVCKEQMTTIDDFLAPRNLKDSPLGATGASGQATVPGALSAKIHSLAETLVESGGGSQRPMAAEEWKAKGATSLARGTRARARGSIPSGSGSAAAAPSASPGGTHQTKVGQFKRGIRRGPPVSPVLGGGRRPGPWFRQLTAKATAQGMKDLLGPSCKPGTPGDGKDNFQQQQEFQGAGDRPPHLPGSA